MKPRCNLLVLALGIVFTTAIAQNAFGQHFRATANYILEHSPIAVAAGDFTGRGAVDIAVQHLDNSVSILASHGDGTFDNPIRYQRAAAPPSAVLALNNTQVHYVSGSQLVSSVSGDFNRDGLPDQAVLSSTSGRLSILLGQTAVPQVFSAGNILQNPGFESGTLTPWYVARNFCSSPCKPWTVVTIHPRTGGFDAGDVGNIEMRQDFTAIDTTTITKVVLWAHHFTGTFLPIAVDFFYTDGTDDEFVVDTTDLNWDSFDLTSDVLSGQMLSGISIFGFSGGGVTPSTFIDNVSILTQ